MGFERNTALFALLVLAMLSFASLSSADMRPFDLATPWQCYKYDQWGYGHYGPTDPLDWSVMNTTLTLDELLCYDGYCYQNTLYVPPVGQQLPSGYATQFEQEVVCNLRWQWLNYFHSTANSANLLNDLVNKNQYDPDPVMNNVSMQVFQSYFNYRQQLVNSGQQLPDITTFDFRTLPNVQPAITWMENFYTKFFSIQIMTHQTQPKNPSGGYPFYSYDSFGLYQNINSFGNGFELDLHWWHAGEVVYPLAHHAHILSTDFLRTARTHVMASLTALLSAISQNYQVDPPGGPGWFGDATGTYTQALIRLANFNNHVHFLLRSENVMKARGDWTGSDQIDTSDIPNGKWSDNDLINYINAYASNMAAAVMQSGTREYLGSYIMYSLKEITMMLIHPSTQTVYESAESIYQLHISLDVANYVPQVGSSAGPVGRSYDPVGGNNVVYQGYIVPTYINPVYYPWCDVLGNASEGDNFYSCQPGTPPQSMVNVNPVSSPPPANLLLVSRSLQELRYGWHPFQAVKPYLLDTWYRTNNWRFDSSLGAEITNFASPFYSIGSGGENYQVLSLSWSLNVKLPGPPLAGYPTTQFVADWPIANLNNIRDIISYDDTPIKLPKSTDTNQVPPREVTAQYQSFALVTHMATPNTGTFSGYGPFTNPLSSNLVLPLAVDGLFADDNPLPRNSGAAAAIPPGSLITVTNQGVSTVIRSLYIEIAPLTNIQDASSFQNINIPNFGSGQQQYTVQWQVDSNTYSLGDGRIVYTHKAANDPSNRPYFVAWLFAVGLTENDAEVAALKQLVSSAVVNSNFQYDSLWQSRLNNNNFTGKQLSDLNFQGNCTWDISVNIAGVLDLEVQRTAVYQPWGNDPHYKEVNNQVPFLTYYTKSANGQPIGIPYDPNSQDPAFRVDPYDPCNVLQPHLNRNVPGCNTEANWKKSYWPRFE